MELEGMPQGGALTRPTAFHFRDVEQHTFVCTAQSTAYRRLLPPGLEWGNDLFGADTLLVSLVHYGSFWPADDPDARIGYDELVIALPCRHRTLGPASYVPFIYLNEFRPTAYGRELFGYPKKLAEISILRDGEHGRGSVVSDLGYPLAALSWQERAGAVLPTDLPAPPPMVNWRRLPKAAPLLEQPSWAVDELTAHEVSIDCIYSHVPLEVEEKSVTLLGGREDPLHEFGEVRTMAATKLCLDWSIPGPPSRVEDFLGR